MKVDARRAQQRQGRSNVHKLITPELRQEVVQLKQRLDDYAGYLDDLFYNLNAIGDAIFRAREFAECLLADDPFKAWEIMKKKEEELDLISIDPIKTKDK
jgi:hypothetical protein